jgi:hypothetical protein
MAPSSRLLDLDEFLLDLVGYLFFGGPIPGDVLLGQVS